MGQVQALAVSRGKNAAEPRSFPNLATLPPEMAHFVLSYLNATDLCLAACVWQQLGNDDILWQGLCKSNWGFTSAYFRNSNKCSFKELYMLLDEGRLTFNYDPEKGISYLISHNVLEDDPVAIAKFLSNSKTDLLKPDKLSEYLKNRRDILQKMICLQNFRMQSLPNALRQFFKLVSPPTTRGEYLEEILSGFAAQYLRCNPECGLPQETVYILCYSLILLCVDLYSPQVKRKMSKREFIKNLRGLALGACDDFIGDLYDDIYIQGHIAKPLDKVYIRAPMFRYERPYGNIFVQA
ncbi:F-box only protein 8-like [Dendronephthya gigantea]|uniref:F-box only protein 8-like n=1 Tax=Dendronephthya gigantea TaxID=151771 RepID=UPI00106B0103|nr:F-box only protein 8-like [Dendronephthya gigantea]